ncbi:MAG: sugar transferase [Alphaproteobacteria bacterium]|nr:sugar transferase [Alphaproteobacteria bacterium]
MVHRSADDLVDNSSASFDIHLIIRSIYPRFGKRMLDTLLILAALPFLLPLMMIIAFLVMLDGNSPIYSQRRLGRDWRPFRLFKFRTMQPDADVVLASYLEQNPEAKAEWDLNQKLRHDPRITRIGRFLRKTSLDELPQLVNVLLGHMSLVGPRPMMPEQRPQYPSSVYATLRPGLTGLWQVSARNGSSFASRATYDEEYSQSLSLERDLSTIFQTFRVMARCTGC